jgi:polyhydroxybutyrate depolymerase
MLRELADHPLRDDVAFTDAMLDVLATDYVIDARRVYATGFSNGGQFALRLAMDRSNRFAAVASSGALTDMDGSPADLPISALVSIGSLDDRYTQPLGLDELPMDESIMTRYLSRGDGLPALLTTLQLEDVYEYQSGTVVARDYAQFTFSTSTVGAENELVLVVLGGMYHVYPNGTNYPLVASNALWVFFSQYSLPE